MTCGSGCLLADFILEQRLQWLGHLGRMDEGQAPKQLLFGELQPFHGPKKRWHDEVVGDLYAIGVEDEWYQFCQDRKQLSSYVSAVLTFLHKSEGQLLVLPTFFLR